MFFFVQVYTFKKKSVIILTLSGHNFFLVVKKSKAIRSLVDTKYDQKKVLPFL